MLGYFFDIEGLYEIFLEKSGLSDTQVNYFAFCELCFSVLTVHCREHCENIDGRGAFDVLADYFNNNFSKHTLT